MKYLVPEYVKNFQCKCGECRTSCCDQWPISISKKEYYHLIGTDCSKKLRGKLDCGLKLSTKPGSEGFAQISADWRGNCLLHLEDGYCALQRELGELSLPNVCRLYPRTTKQLQDHGECSCSNSCEKVMELLLDSKDCLRFEEIELPFQPVFELNITSEQHDSGKKTIAILQDRELPLPERLLELAAYLNIAGPVANKQNDFGLVFQVVNQLTRYYETSISLSDYCKETISYFGLESKASLSAEDFTIVSKRYLAAAKHLEAILPDWPILFEQLLVNHMFYNNFPYVGTQIKAEHAFLALAANYSFLRFHILGYMYGKSASEDLVDCLAALFRVIEHSNFNEVAVRVIQNVKFNLQEDLPNMVYF